MNIRDDILGARFCAATMPMPGMTTERDIHREREESIAEGAADFGAAGVAFLKFVNGFDDLGEAHLVDFETLTNGLEQGDGKLAAKVFPEFLQAIEEDERLAGIGVKEFVGKQFEAERFEELEDAFSGGGVEEAGVAGINHIERDAHGDGFAMADFVFGKL